MLECWSMTVIIFYLFSALLRAGHWVTYLAIPNEDNDESYKNILGSLDEISEIISWTILIYFLFQMHELKNKF